MIAVALAASKPARDMVRSVFGLPLLLEPVEPLVLLEPPAGAWLTGRFLDFFLATQFTANSISSFFSLR